MISEMEKKYPRIYHRHFRKVITHPEGVITHDGDCGIYRQFKICTCGLHHALMFIPDDAEKIYPKYSDEQEGLAKIDILMNEEENLGLFVGCHDCDGKGGVGQIMCIVCFGKGVVPFKMPDPLTEEEVNKLFENLHEGFGSQCIITKDSKTAIHDSGTISENEDKE